MECPVCKQTKHIQIDLHADGFTQNVEECGDCGSVWCASGSELTLLKGRDPKANFARAQFVCPTCHSSTTIETDLVAFQFHEEIFECDLCETVYSFSHNLIEVVKDPQQESFLSHTSDQVEADDYVFV